MGQRVRRDSTTGFRGVTVLKDHPRKRPFSARIVLGGKVVFHKCFETAIEAAKAYNKASHKYHGEYGYRNMIPKK